MGPATIGQMGASHGALLAAVIGLLAPLLLGLFSTHRRWAKLALAGVLPLPLLFGALWSAPGWLSAPVIGDVGVQTHLEGLVEREGLRSMSTRWSAWARTDLIRTGADDAAYAFTDAMFVARSVRWDGNSPRFDSKRMERLAALQRLPWLAGRQEHVLVLGAGAGFGVAIALQQGAQRVQAVEVNGETVAYARRLAAENGRVFARPEVQVDVAEGRRFVRTDDQLYDLVTLALVETAPAVLRGRSHVHARLLTVEAIADYLAHLKPNGIVAITHNAADLAGLSVATALAALDVGQGERTGRLAWIALPNVSPQTNPFSHLLLISARPWTPAQLLALQRQSTALGATTNWQPTAQDEEPPTDERPFFFTRSDGLPPTVWLGIVALLAALILAWRRPGAPPQARPPALDAALVLSGAAAALIQVAAVYRAQVAIGAPAAAMGAALGGLLAGAGVAALLWPRLPALARRPSGACSLAAASALLLWATSPAWSSALLVMSPVAAAGVTVAILAMHGLLLGLPFVALLRACASADDDGEAIAVAQDALGAVMGATCATAIAISLGFAAVFATAAALFFGATLMLVWRLPGAAHGVWGDGPPQTKPHGHEGPGDHDQPGERHGDPADRHQPRTGV